jgi:beta-lactam-binding protein with PASTA domain
VFKFITDRPFWVNLLVIILLSFLLLWGFLQLLGGITKHGEYLTVPSVTAKTTAEAVKLLESKGFEVVIQDSVYTDTAKMGIVLKQFPEPNSTVKVNRVVLLTINRTTLPMVDMPALQGKSLGYALEILRRSHLVVGDTTYKPDFMLGSVLEQRYNGTIITSGNKLPWGSRVDMVIGGGLSNDEVPVPSLLGLTYGEAKLVLEQNGIMLASTVVDPGVLDTAGAFVYKQNPPKLTEDNRPVYIRSGQIMDLWVSKEMKFLTDSTTINQEP